MLANNLSTPFTVKDILNLTDTAAMEPYLETFQLLERQGSLTSCLDTLGHLSVPPVSKSYDAYYYSQNGLFASAGSCLQTPGTSYSVATAPCVVTCSTGARSPTKSFRPKPQEKGEILVSRPIAASSVVLFFIAPGNCF